MNEWGCGLKGWFLGVFGVFGVSFALAEGMEMRGVSRIAALTIFEGQHSHKSRFKTFSRDSVDHEDS